MAHELSHNLKQILKETSRAFYLSLAVLPSSAQRPLSLAYLLARAADTVADSEVKEGTDRVETLEALQACLKSQGTCGPIPLDQFQPQHPGEQRLLEHWPDLLEEFKRADPAESVDIGLVVHTLIDGMIWDQELFQDSPSTGLSPSQLERYTFLVAGCVGPFWSQSCAKGDARLRLLLTNEHRETAIEFGKALQWVNILRDIPKDQEQGRFYLSSLGSNQFWPQFFTGARRALKAFQQAIEYPPLYPWWYLRHRLAVVLPLVLGLRTLEKLFQDGPRQGVRIKVPRSEVFLLLGLGCACASFTPILKKILRHYHTRAHSALKTLESKHE